MRLAKPILYPAMNDFINVLDRLNGVFGFPERLGTRIAGAGLESYLAGLAPRRVHSSPLTQLM